MDAHASGHVERRLELGDAGTSTGGHDADDSEALGLDAERAVGPDDDRVRRHREDIDGFAPLDDAVQRLGDLAGGNRLECRRRDEREVLGTDRAAVTDVE